MTERTADASYYARRAAEERQAADDARDPRARQSHLELAEEYDRAAERERAAGVEPDLKVV